MGTCVFFLLAAQPVLPACHGPIDQDRSDAIAPEPTDHDAPTPPAFLIDASPSTEAPLVADAGPHPFAAVSAVTAVPGCRHLPAAHGHAVCGPGSRGSRSPARVDRQGARRARWWRQHRWLRQAGAVAATAASRTLHR